MIAEAIPVAVLTGALMRAKQRQLSLEGLLVMLTLEKQELIPAMRLSALKKSLSFQHERITDVLFALQVNGYAIRARLAPDRRKTTVMLTRRGALILNEILNSL